MAASTSTTKQVAAPAAPGAAPPAPQETRERDPHRVQTRWMLDHLDKLVKVRLTDGKGFSGRLLAFDQFSVLIEGAGGRVLLYKHAIAYFAPAEEPEPPGA